MAPVIYVIVCLVIGDLWWQEVLSSPWVNFHIGFPDTMFSLSSYTNFTSQPQINNTLKSELKWWEIEKSEFNANLSMEQLIVKKFKMCS